MVIPNLYDLRRDAPAFAALREVTGDLIVLSWLYPRAAHWILDRYGVSGHIGESLMRLDAEDEDEEDFDSDGEVEDDGVQRVIKTREIPARHVYCLDLRARSSVEPFVEEVERIIVELASEKLARWLDGSPASDALARYTSPANDTAAGPTAAAETDSANPVVRFEEESGRRWYPVIDFSRCTNCMECIDFCLFGVYGIDRSETILVEQPDNCRKGCPACSRVCPENAIIFPQHKTAAIAGAPADPGGFKIDLSRLFGAPPDAADPSQLAVQERDEQLRAAGRDTVGESAGIPKGGEEKPDRPRDELDALVEELDELDL
jgi:NAD-dependent dihydropyrimidine dehydrogenase PreA subunit